MNKEAIRRVIKAKEYILKFIHPSRSYMDYVLYHFPAANKKTVYAVWNFRSFDEEAIHILEKTVKKLLKKVR